MLLHPKYWGVWLGFGLLALIVNILPYSILLKLGRSLGKLGMRFGKKRMHVATRNFELAFPDKPAEEVKALVEDNFKNTGMALIEPESLGFGQHGDLSDALSRIDT